MLDDELVVVSVVLDQEEDLGLLEGGQDFLVLGRCEGPLLARQKYGHLQEVEQEDMGRSKRSRRVERSTEKQGE